MGMLNNLFRSARRYAEQNPDTVRKATQKVAGLADRQTKGRYRRQIDRVAGKVDDVTKGTPPGKPGTPGAGDDPQASRP